MSTVMMRSNLGIGVSDLPSIMLKVLEDPALPEVLGLVQQVVDLEASSGSSGGSSGPGVGLDSAVGPLRAYLFIRRNPWAPYAAVAGALLVPFFLGVLVGRATAK